MNAVNAGGCLCGSVRFVFEGEPSASILCHCRSCRRAAAAPSVGWLTVARSAFRLTAGALADHASSAGVTRSFCARCGTPLVYRSASDLAALDVTTVSLDDPTAYPPTREVWLEHRLPWEATSDRIAHFPRGSSDGPSPTDGDAAPGDGA